MPARLKSLELQGYKTFASRTTFEFASTITAIVGPNGSGKSNIADSLRWVLGEQSYSLLRGKKTEDMIFAGSEHRTRAGMASATILFDNSDGWLPIDFSEVAITRRAYRDGENEYLLNGQRVRLRDVSELLAQSGLAERTYTIIGQGLVDAALALKAEERRRLFEEAAGIGLHRSRREEALRRLENTRRNLERVQDILAELQPRLRSLERQARRAKEYEQVKDDLRVLLREWYGYHWHTAQKELAEAREMAHVQERALHQAHAGQAGLDEQLEASRSRLQGLRTRLSDWHRQSAALHSRRETVSRELAVSGERQRALEEQWKNTQDELARLEEELDLYRERVAEATAEVDQLAAELTEARQQVDAAASALEARLAERQDAEKAVQAARQELSNLTARQAHLQTRLGERQSQAKRQRETLQAYQEAVSAAVSELEDAQARLAQVAEALRLSLAEKEAADQAAADLRCRLDEVDNLRMEAQDIRAAHEAEAARLQAQLEVIEQAEKALSGYENGAKLLVEAARQAQLKGARGALSSFLDVPAEIEVAVAAALGQFVNAVLVENETSAEGALNLLEGQPSRAAIIPLAALAAESSLPLPAGEANVPDGIVGVASELVGAPPDLTPVVRLLLGQTLIVRSRPAARRLLAHLGSQSPALRVVTLSGEVFFAGGPILAGQEGKSGVLGRPRQRKELRAHLDEVETQVRETGERLQGLTHTSASLRSEGDRLAERAREAANQVENARAAHRQLDLAFEKAQRQLGWQREQVARLEEDLAYSTDESSKIEGELRFFEDEIENARLKLREANAGLAGLPLEEYQTGLSHWQTRAAVAERAMTGMQNRCQERQASLDRAMQVQAGLQKRLEEFREARASSERRKVELRQAEADVSREIEALRVHIEPAETELEAGERDQAELETQVSSARQTLSLAEHRHAQARISLARRQEALDGLQRRIEDDFGLVAFEYVDEISGPTPLPLDGMVEQLPLVHSINPEIDETIKRQRTQLRRMGPVNPEAQLEYQQVKERFEFLKEQVNDLSKAEKDVKEIIAELDQLMEREFGNTFEAVAQEFRSIFTRLFGGGSARLVLTDPSDLTNTGIDIEARLPGRREQGLSLLSGGERSLTATALVFALLKVSPTPFCVLDEVDAMLDEANVGRFRDLLAELSQTTQFVIVTHNRNTVQAADVIYGVTMGRDSASQVIGLRLDDVERVIQ